MVREVLYWFSWFSRFSRFFGFPGFPGFPGFLGCVGFLLGKVGHLPVSAGVGVGLQGIVGYSL